MLQRFRNPCWKLILRSGIAKKEYEDAKRRIQSLEVVNDNAERGIALIKTYNSKLSTDENQKQFILQLVEEHRKMYKSPNKSDVIQEIYAM